MSDKRVLFFLQSQSVNAPSSIISSVIEAFIFNLLKIKTSSGYNTTVRNVYCPAIELDNMIEYPSINIISLADNCANDSMNNHEPRKLFNSLTLTMDCVLNTIENSRQERNKLLADIQKYFGINWGIPNEFGVHTSFNCFYESSTPWGIDKMRPFTGITISYVIWYDQNQFDPMKRG